ncbi:MAG: carboxypeptidase-like regulatory domain-containing protein [Chitinophagaceae bacterium]|nr:carboxypeptidase-like regulatory domain-containing protein [Chitinophagaceae bacterium]
MKPHLLILFLFCSLLSYSQKIKGVVTDTTGKPLSNSSIFVKGSTKGVNANSEGKYSLKLEPGKYTLVCQHVGFGKQEASITVTNDDHEINFVLKVQEMLMSEVIVSNKEDPAYEVIRNAIKKREFYKNQPGEFECMVYTKGQVRLRDYPKKILGQKVDFEDGDTSKKKILYLSETISKYKVSRPNKVKIEVVSSKVSGSDNGFGLSAPQFYSFYNNTIQIGSGLNPRGFISPISENALNYYKYKLEGTYFEDSNLVNHIKVIPKRKYEPLFSGYIDIIEGDWRIHSVKLQLLKESQMELLDTLRIEQLYRPIDKDTWFFSSQVMYAAIKILGFDSYGNFVNVYTDADIDPGFTRKTFNNVILKYTDSSNKRTDEYWEKNRPIALMEDEVNDYRVKDSLLEVRKDPRYLDSLDKKRNKITLQNLLLLGQGFSNSKKRTFVSILPVMENVNFNPAEGLVVSTGFHWSKRLDSGAISRRRIQISPVIRYGFANNHFNSHLTASYTFGKKYFSSVMLSGGKRVFQFNANSPISERSNTTSSLLEEDNRLKTYEAWYLRGSYRRGIGDGFSLVTGFQYQDRMPLDNRTNYTWRDKNDRQYTPNYPYEIMNENIKRHQVFMLVLGVTWQPGSRYIELADRKINVGSKLPVFSAGYTIGIKNVFGSDANFSKWNVGVSDNINFKLAGNFRYRLMAGGFIDTGSNLQVPDYKHFNGNISTMATEYMNSFQLLPIYQFSNKDKFYLQGHVEYNLKGFLTNKIPGIRRLNVYLVTGANAFYINNNKYYYEWFAGIDNIFKRFRVDFVQSYLNGKKWNNGIRIGFGLSRARRDDWP